MDTNDMAELIYNRFLKADRTTQRGILRYTLRHCGLSVLLDILCYFDGIS